jgi:hypothetical protein
MKRILTAFVFSLLPVASYSQEVSSAVPNLSVITSTVKENGWKIPGLSQSRITDPRRLVPKGYGVSGIQLHLTVLKPKREFIETISLYGLKDDGKTLVIGERRGAVKSIIKCDIDNRVFAYIVQFVAVLYDPQSRRGGYGGIYGAQYFDNNGDGIFESYEPGAPFVTPALRVPEWALKGK